MVPWGEKRKFPRVFIKLNVECKGNSFWQYVETRDLSVGGMFVVTDKTEPPQSKIEIMLEFDQVQKVLIRVEGVVAWIRPEPAKEGAGELQPAGMGIQFTKITPASGTKYIEQLVKQIQEKSDG